MLHRTAGDPFHRFYRPTQGMAIIGIAGFSQHAHHKVAFKQLPCAPCL